MAGVAAAGVAGISYFCSCSKYVSAVETAPQLTSREFVLARTNCTLAGACGRSGICKTQTVSFDSRDLINRFGNIRPTCFQIPQVFTADLVVPRFAVTVTSTPHVKSGINGHSTVTSTGPRDVVFKGVHQNSFPTHGVCRNIYKRLKDPLFFTLILDVNSI